MLLQYNTLLFNCENCSWTWLISNCMWSLLSRFLKGKTFHQYLIVWFDHWENFNAVLKKVRVKLVLLRLKLISEAEEMAELAMSAKDQITKQMDSSLKPKIEVLLAKKAKPHLIFMLWTSHLLKYLRISLYHWGYIICQNVYTNFGYNSSFYLWVQSLL